VDRDALLAAALGAAVLTGCTAPRRVPALPSPSPSSAPPPDPDAALLSSWAASERRVAGLYGPGGPLAPLRANHLARAVAVEALLVARGASPAPSPAPARPAAVAALLTAERSLATAYLASLARAGDPAVAVLGAELAAGARQHAALLPLVPARR
jgi:hypothetical protein